jgi:hypothetical protein
MDNEDTIAGSAPEDYELVNPATVAEQIPEGSGLCPPPPIDPIIEQYALKDLRVPEPELYKLVNADKSKMTYENRHKYYEDPFDESEHPVESLLLYIFNRDGSLKKYNKLYAQAVGKIREKGIEPVLERIESERKFEYKLHFKNVPKIFSS